MPSYGPDRRELAQARSAVQQLFAIVRPECLYERPIPLRHRLIFYLGHVEAFDWNLIVEHGLKLPRFHAELDRLFALGIDPEAGQAPSDTPSDWPELARVQEYGSRIREQLDAVWDDIPQQLRHVCIEHRLMHAETLAYLLHNMDHHMLVRPSEPEDANESDVQHGRVLIPAGQTLLGKHRSEGFGWDNEFDKMTVDVGPFAIDRYKVTNGQYLAFVDAGGLTPQFWQPQNGSWFLRRMFDNVPLPLSWPVWVTQQQAAAYAEWSGASLPTEAQWHHAAYGQADGVDRQYPWGEAAPVAGTHGNFGAGLWDASPVNAYPSGQSAFGVDGLLGNGWEWISTPFRPFPGFQPFPFYPGYSADFFDDDHYVLKGGSPRTDAVLLRRSFRNWFRSDYPYAFAGFRCVHKHK